MLVHNYQTTRHDITDSNKYDIVLKWKLWTGLSFTLKFEGRRPWKPLRPSEQRPLWFTSAKRCWMISLSSMQWDFFGSLDMPEYGVMKSPMGSQGAVLLWRFSDPSRPWGSLGKIYKWGSVADWLTSTETNGKVLVIPEGRLTSLSRDLVWAPGQNLWPLIGLNPGLWLAFSWVITPWGDISTY